MLGALTGAAVALLLAPATGEETRRILTEKAKEGREKATDAARQGREFLNRQRDTLGTAHRSRPRGLQSGAQRGAAGSGRGESVNLSETFLGVIAAATLLMALIQVGAIVAILRVARQAQQTIADVQRDVRPLIERPRSCDQGHGDRRRGVADGDDRDDSGARRSIGC